jgi:hypothetical protein
MRDVAWRFGLTLATLTALVILGPSFSCGTGNRLIEQITGQTPRAQIAAYMSAIASGDRQAALDIWTLSDSSVPELIARRKAVTDLLLSFGPQIEYRILDTEWYRTCCEPAVIQNPDAAGGASVRVAISSPGTPEAVYIFDLWVPGGYWGEAMGSPVRHWTIVDVYPEAEAPLVLIWIGREQ